MGKLLLLIMLLQMIVVKWWKKLGGIEMSEGIEVVKNIAKAVVAIIEIFED